jgi:integrase
LALVQEEEQQENPIAVFMYALKAPETKRQWPRRLKTFFDFLPFEGVTTIEGQAKLFVYKARRDPQWAQNSLMRFITYQLARIQRGEISESTIRNYTKATKLFCEMNDLSFINWKKLTRGLPKANRAANDRAPTLEEIRSLVEYPDRRIKPIVYVMVSSGIRIGSWNYLRWKDIRAELNREGEVTAAIVKVYAGENEEYFSCITPEAYNSLKSWMDFRASYGEKITGESWVMRDLWQTTNANYGSKLGLATCPKKLKSSGIKSLIERALWEQGVRHKLPSNAKRHEWKAAHGFRKFYKSRAEQVMRPINVEITMGHDIGISHSYYKPTEREVIDDYLKAVPLLTINGDKSLLQKQIGELKEKSRDSEYIIKSKLLEKEKKIEMLEERQEHFEYLIRSLIDTGQLKPKEPVSK